MMTFDEAVYNITHTYVVNDKDKVEAGNQYLRDLKASHDSLMEALSELTPPMPPDDAMCHIGIVSQEKCCNCGRIARAHAALKSAEALK